MLLYVIPVFLEVTNQSSVLNLAERIQILFFQYNIYAMYI